MARSSDDARLCFKALYHDELSGLSKEFQLKFYLNDASVELTDLGTRRAYLKRTAAKNLSSHDFVVGKTIVVFGRLLHLTDYMDDVTRQLCEGIGGGSAASPAASPQSPITASVSSASNATLRRGGLLGSGVCYVFAERTRHFAAIGRVLSVLGVELGFTITGVTAGTLPAAAVAAYAKAAVSGDAVAAATVAAVRPLSGKMLCCFRIAKAGGCADSIAEIYRRICPPNRFGDVGVGADGVPPAGTVGHLGLLVLPAPSAQTAAEGLFDAIVARSAAKHTNPSSAVGTVVIVKPHVLLGKCAGDVIDMLIGQSGAELVGMALINLSARDATSMLAAYRGVLPEFHGTASHLSSGAAIAIHLCSAATAAVLASEDSFRDGTASAGDEGSASVGPAAVGGAHAAAHGGAGGGDDYEVFLAVRALCGPFDPAIAKALRGTTVRARYGIDRSLNAVHCCDIADDVSGVCRFIFAHVATRRLLDPSSEAS